jgi:hypothetical protein
MNVVQTISLDARMLYERLQKTGVGDVIEYEELTSVIGKDVRNGARRFLDTARNRALNSDHMVFGTIIGVGIKRLSDVDIVSTGEYTRRRIRRMSGRAIKTLTAVRDFNSLPNDAKIRHNTFVSLYSAISHASSNPSVKRIEAQVSESNSKLALIRTLEALKG